MSVVELKTVFHFHSPTEGLGGVEFVVGSFPAAWVFP